VGGVLDPLGRCAGVRERAAARRRILYARAQLQDQGDPQMDSVSFPHLRWAALYGGASSVFFVRYLRPQIGAVLQK
jgi:hypothetical protein